MRTKRSARLASIPQNGLCTCIRLYCFGRPSVCRLATLWLSLSFGLASCSSANKEQAPGSDAPDEEKEIVVLDFPLLLDDPDPLLRHYPRRFNPEHLMQHRSVPESVRKKTMDAYLRIMSRLSADGKDMKSCNPALKSFTRVLKKEGYYGEMRKRGYMYYGEKGKPNYRPAVGHPNDYVIIFDTKYFPCMCLDIYQTLRDNPAYLDGIGLKGFSRSLTYCQSYSGDLLSVCRFPQHLLNGIGIYSMEAPPLREGEQLSEGEKALYKRLHRVYYTDQDKSSLFPQQHGN